MCRWRLSAWTRVPVAARQPDWTNRSPAWREQWPRWPGAAIVERQFGSWNAALEAAGLPTRRCAWTPPEVLSALAAWAYTHGRPPTLSDARTDPALPVQGACERHFGSWNDALRAAGLAPNQESRLSDQRVRQALAAWAAWQRTHGTGEPSAASYRAWAARQAEAVPSASSVRRRFGGWWSAVRAAAGFAAARPGGRGLPDNRELRKHQSG
jgi:hypothetical protein